MHHTVVEVGHASLFRRCGPCVVCGISAAPALLLTFTASGFSEHSNVGTSLRFHRAVHPLGIHGIEGTTHCFKFCSSFRRSPRRQYPLCLFLSYSGPFLGPDRLGVKYLGLLWVDRSPTCTPSGSFIINILETSCSNPSLRDQDISLITPVIVQRAMGGVIDACSRFASSHRRISIQWRMLFSSRMYNFVRKTS